MPFHPMTILNPEIEAALRSGKTVVRIPLERKPESMHYSDVTFSLPATGAFHYAIIDGEFFDLRETPCHFEQSKAWRFGGEYGRE